MARGYRHIQEYEKEILELKAQGATHREIAEHLGFTKEQVKGFFKRQHKKERRGVHHNPKTILRVMNKYNPLSVVRRRRYCNYSKALHRYENLLNRDFHADRPNQKWVTDISYTNFLSSY